MSNFNVIKKEKDLSPIFLRTTGLTAGNARIVLRNVCAEADGYASLMLSIAYLPGKIKQLSKGESLDLLDWSDIPTGGYEELVRALLIAEDLGFIKLIGGHNPNFIKVSDTVD